MSPSWLGSSFPSVVFAAVLQLACASPPGSNDGTPPIAIEYRLASFSLSPLRSSTDGSVLASCLSGLATETLEYVYPTGRPVSVEVATTAGFAVEFWQAEVTLHEMPLEDGLQVAALAEIKLHKRQMKGARKFRSKHANCEFAVFLDGVLADLLWQESSWEEALPGGRFATVDQAREIYQPPAFVVTIVPESLDVTRWRRDFRRWQAYLLRWRFRCDAAFRTALARQSPSNYARMEVENGFFLGNSCDVRPAAPPHPRK